MHLTEDQVTQQLHKLFKAFMTNEPNQMNDSMMRNDFRAFARDNYAHAKHIVEMFVKQYINIFVSPFHNQINFR